ncbi:MAG: SIMPL domain-containing protein [Methanomicrobiaceae archaeon]|nr:SIMPL domain-containing protein [Methanomicrobiaceae archaeon]
MALNDKLALFMAVLLVACIAIFAPGAAQTEQDSGNERVIHVTGTGTVTTTPDQAEISLAVETENTDVKTAQAENAARMTKVINALKAAGLTEDNLSTTGYTIYPVYDDKPASSSIRWNDKIKYYRVSNTLLVSLDEIDRVGEVIDLAVASGADRVNYLSFGLSDEKSAELRSEALGRAVQYARNDADAVTTAMNLAIVGVKEIHVGGPVYPVRYAETPAYDMAMSVPTPIEPTDVDVTATVTITYLLG